MAASYPSSVKSFSTKATNDVIEASHVNDLQDEVTAVETGLLSGIGHTLLPLVNNTYDLGSASKAFKDLYVAGNFSFAGAFASVLKPDANNTRDIGLTGTRWKDIFAAGNAYLGKLYAGDGAVGTPGITFENDLDVGLYRSGANALDFATNGVKALGIDSTQFVDSPTQPRTHVTNSGTQSLTDSTLTAINFDTETFDVGSMHDNVTNNSRITVPTGGDGLYLAVCMISYASNATGVRMARIRKNGATALATTFTPAVSGDVTSFQAIALASLVATDYVEAIGYQTSGGALNVAAAGASLFLVKLW